MPWLAGFLWASTAHHFYWLVDLSQLLSALKTPTQLTSKGKARIGVEIHGVLQVLGILTPLRITPALSLSVRVPSFALQMGSLGEVDI